MKRNEKLLRISANVLQKRAERGGKKRTQDPKLVPAKVTELKPESKVIEVKIIL